MAVAESTPASPAAGKKRPTEYIIDKDDVNETPLDNYFSWTDAREMFECYAYLPDKECYLNLSADIVE
jgi:hypothetical protein